MSGWKVLNTVAVPDVDSADPPALDVVVAASLRIFSGTLAALVAPVRTCCSEADTAGRHASTDAAASRILLPHVQACMVSTGLARLKAAKTYNIENRVQKGKVKRC